MGQASGYNIFEHSQLIQKDQWTHPGDDYFLHDPIGQSSIAGEDEVVIQQPRSNFDPFILCKGHVSPRPLPDWTHVNKMAFLVKEIHVLPSNPMSLKRNSYQLDASP